MLEIAYDRLQVFDCGVLALVDLYGLVKFVGDMSELFLRGVRQHLRTTHVDVDVYVDVTWTLRGRYVDVDVYVDVTWTYTWTWTLRGRIRGRYVDVYVDVDVTWTYTWTLRGRYVDVDVTWTYTWTLRGRYVDVTWTWTYMWMRSTQLKYMHDYEMLNSVRVCVCMWLWVSE